MPGQCRLADPAWLGAAPASRDVGAVRRPAARLSFISLGRLSDARFDAGRIAVRAQRSRWAASLGPFPFKEEVMGSNPIRATENIRELARFHRREEPRKSWASTSREPMRNLSPTRREPRLRPRVPCGAFRVGLRGSAPLASPCSARVVPAIAIGWALGGRRSSPPSPSSSLLVPPRPG